MCVCVCVCCQVGCGVWVWHCCQAGCGVWVWHCCQVGCGVWVWQCWVRGWKSEASSVSQLGAAHPTVSTAALDHCLPSQLCRERGLHKYELLEDPPMTESRCHSTDLPSRPASVCAMREAAVPGETAAKKATSQLVSGRSACAMSGCPVFAI